MAEYFRDEMHLDVLLFVDNIFRFTQAGSEVSTLLGRMPSRGGLPAHPGRRDGRAAGADHVDEGPLDHVAAGDLRAGRRHHRPGAAHHVRAPGRHHGALARHLGARHLPGGGPARLDLADPRPALRRRGALRRGPAGAGDPAAQQGPPGHHRDPRRGRAVRGGQGHRRPGPADPAVPVPAVLRGRAVHRHPRQVRAGRRDDRRRSRRCARASTTICPSRPSSWSAASRKPSRRRSRWRRPSRAARGPRRHARARGLVRRGRDGDRARRRGRGRHPWPSTRRC